MSRHERSHELLEKIDAVLSECGKDPRRRPPARPAWRGRSWAQEWARAAGDRPEGPDTLPS